MTEVDRIVGEFHTSRASAEVASHDIGNEGGNDLIRGPNWRTRTSPQRRAFGAAITFALIAVVGTALMAAAIWVLDRLGSPTWLATVPWIVPTTGALVWTLLRPAPAVVTDDDDDSWAGYAIRYVMVGENSPRGVPVRLLAALVFGAPVTWALLVFGLSTLIGLF